jgi:uncharacterized protein YggE
MKILAVIAAVVFLGLTAAAQVKPTVSVVGQASLSIAPDEVVFTFEIVTDDKEIVAAKRENDARTSRTLATAAAFGIAAKDIQTDSLTISPQYTGDRDPRGSHVLISYEVTKRVLVTLKNVDQIDSFVSKVVDAGVNRISNVSIQNSQLDKYEQEVRAMAIKNAQAKAAAYAAQLGQSVGKAYVVREEEADSPEYDRFSGSGNGTGNGDSGDIARIGETPKAFDQPVTFALGQISVEQKIYVLFELNR